MKITHRDNAAIAHLKKLEEKYECCRQTHIRDLKYGVPRMADPVFYDGVAHLEIKEAIEILLNVTVRP